MKNELDYVSQRLLNALCEEAPKMQLSKAITEYFKNLDTK